MFGVAEFENDQPLDSKGYFRAKTAVIQHSDWIQKRAQGKTKMKKLGGLMRGKAAGWKDRFMIMTQFELSYFMDDPGRTAEGTTRSHRLFFLLNRGPGGVPCPSRSGVRGNPTSFPSIR